MRTSHLVRRTRGCISEWQGGSLVRLVRSDSHLLTTNNLIVYRVYCKRAAETVKREQPSKGILA